MTRITFFPFSDTVRKHGGSDDFQRHNGQPSFSSKWLLCAAMLSAIWSPAAHAYRPFDGTDAGVAEPGVFELELGPVGYVRRAAEKSVIAPAIAANFGLEGDTEIVLEGRVNRQLGDTAGAYRTNLGDTAFSVKHVFRRGSLQDGSGPSIASECGVLLPEIHRASGTGATCAGIVSRRWDAASVHLNAALTRTREHTTNRFLGVIVEGPEAWPIRPVTEVFAERATDGSRTNSALVGFIWKQSDDLAFDAGVRKARMNDQNLTEVRLGLTWNFPLPK
jgi:hypothetical protein